MLRLFKKHLALYRQPGKKRCPVLEYDGQCADDNPLPYVDYDIALSAAPRRAVRKIPAEREMPDPGRRTRGKRLSNRGLYRGGQYFECPWIRPGIRFLLGKEMR